MMHLVHCLDNLAEVVAHLDLTQATITFFDTFDPCVLSASKNQIPE